ncbi:hypothetical protein SUGI_1034740 [Cryptomeria japonica]|nr:hypothetical protein SUGI_1034740 [Cryptomeria japonica]
MGKKRNRNAAADEKSPTKEKEQTNNDTHNEIEEIFAKAKKPKNVKSSNLRITSAIKNDKPDEQDIKSSSEVSDKKQKNGKGWPEPPPKPRRKTNDGFSVYSADELGFNKKDAGGTPLCPFDCDCCF